MDTTSPLAISASKISKCYPIYDKPFDRLKQIFIRDGRQFFEEYWALKSISFEIRVGETVGIIGRNGSGKSTLLQILCGTLSQTSGDFILNGKVAALLELGAGFNPEFSGLENIRMAAAIYGLDKKQTQERLEDIIKFADIGTHIDQPVKTYSSGMYVRLAFAVIAHVDADILVIDEALAVGDAVFTQKCMRFIRQFKEKGTLLFVSHDMNSVLTLCDRAIWLHEGELIEEGSSKQIAQAYLQSTLQDVYGSEASLEDISEPERTSPTQVNHSQDNPETEYSGTFEVSENLSEANGWKSGGGEILSVQLSHDGHPADAVLLGGEAVCMSITATAHQTLDRPILGFLVRDRLGQDLFGENTLGFTNLQPIKANAGEKISAQFCFKLPMLPNGQYVVMASLADGDLVNNIQHHWLHDALVLTVSSSKIRWGLVGIPYESVNLKIHS